MQQKPSTPQGQPQVASSSPRWVFHTPQPNPLISPLQAKLTVGEPGDRYEQEADRVAAQVMSVAPPIPPSLQRQAEGDELQTKPLAETIAPIVQRKEEKEDPLQAKCEACEEEQVQRAANGTVQAQPDLASRLNTSQGGGSPLPDEVRGFMEPRFGTDFSQVRVHADSNSVQMNRELGAQAFTHRNHIHYSAGKAPTKDELMGHELTHVVQQTGSANPLSLMQQIQTNLLGSSLIQRNDNPQTPETREEMEEVNYVFFFTNGDSYGRAARAFIQANYPDYRSFSAASLEQMFDRLYEDWERLVGCDR